MNNLINKDINPDFTYAKTHISIFQNIGVYLAIFRSDFSYDNCDFLNNIRRKPTPFKLGD